MKFWWHLCIFNSKWIHFWWSIDVICVFQNGFIYNQVLMTIVYFEFKMDSFMMNNWWHSCFLSQPQSILDDLGRTLPCGSHPRAEALPVRKPSRPRPCKNRGSLCLAEARAVQNGAEARAVQKPVPFANPCRAGALPVLKPVPCGITFLHWDVWVSWGKGMPKIKKQRQQNRIG